MSSNHSFEVFRHKGTRKKRSDVMRRCSGYQCEPHWCPLAEFYTATRVMSKGRVKVVPQNTCKWCSKRRTADLQRGRGKWRGPVESTRTPVPIKPGELRGFY